MKEKVREARGTHLSSQHLEGEGRRIRSSSLSTQPVENQPVLHKAAKVYILETPGQPLTCSVSLGELVYSPGLSFLLSKKGG